MRCTKCNKDNREEAAYCKWCGEKLVDVAEKEFKTLVGMDDIKQQLRDVIHTHEALKYRERLTGVKAKTNLNMLILGDAGMGKTKLLQVIQTLFHANKIISKNQPKVIDASDFLQFANDFDSNIKAASDGILCIENAQKLLPDGEVRQITDLDILFNGMKKWQSNPIVILMGTESGLGSFVECNPSVASLFRYQFHLQPYTPEQIIELVKLMLKTEGALTMEEKAAEKLDRVLKQFYRDYPGVSMSANIAVDKSREIMEAAIRRDQKTTVVTEDDITGDEYVRKTTEEAIAAFDEYVGVDNIKQVVRQIANKLEMDAERNGGTAKREVTDHFLFLGNPGTGKTTMARLLADVLNALEVLPIGQLVEVSRSDLVAEYLGQTAPRVVECVNRAMGGILFIDEAYSLKQGDNDPFGQEAIDTLLKLMEDRRGQFVCIAAGYNKEMADFISSNSGLESRFNKTVQFHDYTADELTEIFRRMVSRHSMVLDDEAEKNIGKFFKKMYARRSRNFANAREVRTAYENACKNQADRIQEAKATGQFTPDMLAVLTLADIEGENAQKPVDIQECLAQLDELVGLANVKDEVRGLAQTIMAEQRRAQLMGHEYQVTLDHYLFLGNPGTGKTTVARIMANIFCSLGLLPTAKLVEVTRKDLVSTYVGGTAPKVAKVVQSAIGGVLFIDEAYALNQGPHDNYGREAIDTLLPLLLDYKGQFICIAAGYTYEMQQWVETNSGLPSRFNKTIHFEDYTGEQLADIFCRIVAKQGFTMTPEAEQKMRSHFDKLYTKRDRQFGNAREVNNYFTKVKQRQGERLYPRLIDNSATKEELCTFEADDM